MKVLHCIYDDLRNPWVGGGGAQRAFEIYRRLAGRVDVTVVTGDYPGAHEDTLDGVEFRRLGARRPYAWSRATYGLAATRLLRKASYDAAVFDYSAYTPLFVPRDRPVGLSVHHLTSPTARARWGSVAGWGVGVLERALLARARFVSLSAAIVEPEVRAAVGPQASIEVVGAGVSRAFFEVERAERGYVLFFGRLDVFQKGLDTLLDAFARIHESHPGVRLKIAGRGKDGAVVARLARERGVADAMDLLGPVSDEERLALLAGATIMLMPSRFEGFGLVAAEAMAAGVPLVASDAGSLPEVIAPPTGGTTVPVGDATALAAAAVALLDDAGRRAELSASARESAARYTWVSVAERHYRFLERIAGSRERGER